MHTKCGGFLSALLNAMEEVLTAGEKIEIKKHVVNQLRSENNK